MSDYDRIELKKRLKLQEKHGSVIGVTAFIYKVLKRLEEKDLVYLQKRRGGRIAGQGKVLHNRFWQASLG